MKVSIEILYHLRCDSCGAWWSSGDRKPKPVMTCPECEHRNTVEGFQNGKGKDVNGLEWVEIESEDQPISFDPDDYPLL